MRSKKKKRKGDLLAEPVLDINCALDAHNRLEVVLTQNETIIGKLEMSMKTHQHPELFGFEKITSLLKYLGSYPTDQLGKISDNISSFEDHIKQLKNKLQKKLDKSEDKIKVVSDLTALKNALNSVVDIIRIHIDELEDYRVRTKRIKREETRAAQAPLKKKKAKLKAKEEKKATKKGMFKRAKKVKGETVIPEEPTHNYKEPDQPITEEHYENEEDSDDEVE